MFKEEISLLQKAALYHELGKLLILSVIDKQGPLSKTDRLIVRMHPAFSVMMLGEEDANDVIADLIFFHHAYPDGSGFPMISNPLPLLYQILQASDVFDAVNSERLYRKKKVDHWEEIERKLGFPESIINSLKLIQDPQDFLIPYPVKIESNFISLFA